MAFSSIKNTFSSANAKRRTVISMQEVIEAFDELADNKDIAFNYPRDGCYARAHLMCESLIEKGIEPKKAWAFEGKMMLAVEIDGSWHRWWFHVAPVVDVEIEKGKVESMVIDPAIFDGPVTFKDWYSMINAEPEKAQIAYWRKPPKGYSGDYTPYKKTCGSTTDFAYGEMIDFLARGGKGQRVVYQSKIRQQWSQQTQSPVKTAGKTWVQQSRNKL